MKTFQTLSELSALVGQEVAMSDWISITQERVDQFAQATGDHQWIHVDQERAKNGPFGGTIAHGFLTLSMLARFLQTGFDKPDVKATVNYGFDKVRFLSPVKSGKRIRGHFKLLDLTEKRAGQWVLKLESTVEIEGEDKPALLAEWILQLVV